MLPKFGIAAEQQISTMVGCNSTFPYMELAAGHAKGIV
jgi:hypothetical protein